MIDYSSRSLFEYGEDYTITYDSDSVEGSGSCRLEGSDGSIGFTDQTLIFSDPETAFSLNLWIKASDINNADNLEIISWYAYEYDEETDTGYNYVMFSDLNIDGNSICGMYHDMSAYDPDSWHMFTLILSE